MTGLCVGPCICPITSLWVGPSLTDGETVAARGSGAVWSQTSEPACARASWHTDDACDLSLAGGGLWLLGLERKAPGDPGERFSLTVPHPS